MSGLEEIWASRYALRNLVLKDFKVRYRNMSLGVVWSVINPLVLLGVLSFVFTFIFPNKQEYFAVFILLGLVAYNFFSLCLTAVTPSIIENAPLVKKVIFPRIIVPLSVVFSQLLHVLIQMGLLLFFIILFRVPFAWSYLWLPVFYLVELVFIIGLSLACSALCVYFRDMRYIVESAATLLFWFTPIFYPLGQIHDSLPRPIYVLYILNPLAGCIEGGRRAVLSGVGPDAISFAAACIVSVVTMVVGILVFQNRQRDFADMI